MDGDVESSDICFWPLRFVQCKWHVLVHVVILFNCSWFVYTGRLLTALISEYLDWAQLNHTLKVYLPECNLVIK